MKRFVAVALLGSFLPLSIFGEVERIDPSKLNPEIYYYTEKDGEMKPDIVSADRWRHFAEGGRYEYLKQFYYATTRAISTHNKRHAVCYQGLGSEVKRTFFSDQEKYPIKNVKALGVTVSEDEMMIGLEGTVNNDGKEISIHYRISSCLASGKNPIADSAKKEGQTSIYRRPSTFMLASMQKTDAPTGEATIATAKLVEGAKEKMDGFSINDKVTKEEKGKLPLFKLRADFEKAKVEKEPWSGMDISSEKGSEEFVELLQAYFYDGLANQNSDPDQNFIATKSKKRYWCHMPWLNQGSNGREAIHGLTNERPLNPSPMYPFDRKKVSGSDWGVAFYNGIACEAMKDVFSGTKDRKVTPDWFKKFPDGSMSVKILFTTADFPQIHDAFTWNGHVSLPFQTERKIRSLRHLQMDIAVKDSRIKGMGTNSDGWMMTTYYFDKGYQAPAIVSSIKNLPEGLKHMRPLGIQRGFEVADSIVFKGALTNQDNGMVNGPADNPKSTCLSCHGTAGTKVPMVPGVMDNDEWVKLKPEALDMSQQLSLARRNFQTQSAKRK